MPLKLCLAGEEVELHGDRALYWPARARLLIADLHLGKADIFRQLGIALPSGGTEHDLQRLSALIANTGAGSLWVLGDLLHGALVDSHWRRAWQDWRTRHSGLDLAVLTGNHDRALAATDLDLRLIGGVHDDGPFRFQHMPAKHPEGRHIVCGHLHPVTMLGGIRRRWPAFWLRGTSTVLPAFSAFTGGAIVTPDRGDRLVACIDGAAIEAVSVRERRRN